MGNQVTYDLAIIGSGPGGYVCALEAKKLGLNPVVIEKSKHGGVCANTGCIPTKALKASAEVYHTITSSEPYGINGKIEGIFPDKVFQRARNIADQSSKSVAFLLKRAGIEVILGEASVLDKNTVEVNGLQLKCKNLVLATGTKARVIPHPGTEKAKSMILTSDTVFNMDKVPKSIAILGGGVIGCEFAGIFPMLGVKVTVIEPNKRLLSAFDPDIGEFLARQFKEAGIDVISGLAKVEITEDGVAIDGTGYQFEKVLLSVGRTYILPKGAESLGLAMKKHGIVEVDSHMQTNVPGVYAIGDIVGGMVAHAAYEHGRIAARNIAGKPDQFVNIVPHVIYTSPEIAVVGDTVIRIGEEAKKKTRKIPYSANGRAMTDGKTKGFAKVALDSNDKILGAVIAGQRAGEIIAYFAMAIRLGMTASELKKTIFPHPTYSEIVYQLLD